MKIVTILKTLQLVGSATPAFKALFDEAVSTFRADEQDVLKKGYAAAMAKSDVLHSDVQDELKAASKDAGKK